MSGGRKTKYRPEYHPEEVRKLAESGMTEKEIAEKFGVNKDTIATWKNRYPEFSDSLAEGKKKPNRAMEAAVFKRGIGGKVREVIYKPGEKEGDPAIPIRIIERDLPGNTRSQEFWLINRMPHRWRRRMNIDIGPGIDGFNEQDEEKTDIILENLKRLSPEMAAVFSGNGNGNGHHGS
jgi:transposase-like protein